MRKFTNRDLARVFGVSLTQIKRWAVIVLGRDPEADQSGGVRREYTLDDAFIIYFFGVILVGDFRMGLKEAKVHLDHIRPQLIAEKLLPSNFDRELPYKAISELIPLELQAKAEQRKNQRPFINITIFQANYYLIEWGIFTWITINGKQESETYSIRKYFPTGWPFPYVLGTQYVIFLVYYLDCFL